MKPLISAQAIAFAVCFAQGFLIGGVIGALASLWNISITPLWGFCLCLVGIANGYLCATVTFPQVLRFLEKDEDS